jgi:hypothetical protein
VGAAAPSGPRGEREPGRRRVEGHGKGCSSHLGRKTDMLFSSCDREREVNLVKTCTLEAYVCFSMNGA